MYRSSHRSCSLKKGVLRNFAELTGKHLRQSLFFNEVAGLRRNFTSAFVCRVVTACFSFQGKIFEFSFDESYETRFKVILSEQTQNQGTS